MLWGNGTQYCVSVSMISLLSNHVCLWRWKRNEALCSCELWKCVQIIPILVHSSFLTPLQPEEIEEQQAKYEMVFKNIEELDRQGIQILSPREIERLRKRFRDVHTKFTQYQKPAGDGKWSWLLT